MDLRWLLFLRKSIEVADVNKREKLMMKEKKIKISIEEVLYIGFFSVMLFAKGIGLYDGQVLYKLLFLMAMMMAVAKICITTHSLKEWVVIGILGSLTVIIYLVSREKGILLCAAVVLAVKNVSIKRLFKVGAWVWGLSMAGNLFWHLLFLETSGYKVHEKLGLGHIFRWDLGFSHPNVLHIAYLTFAALIVYNLGKKYDWKAMFWLMAGNLFVFLYSVSYTGIIVVTLYLCMAWYVNIRKNMGKAEYILMESVFPICLFLSFLSPFLLPEKLFNIINKIFSTRLSLARYFLVEENMKLFGNNLEEITTYQLTMDNSYVFGLVIYGIVFFILITIAYFGTIHSLIKGKNTDALVMTIVFLIAGISEPFLFNTAFKNITLVFVGEFLFKSLKKRGIEGKEWGILSIADRVIELQDIRDFERAVFLKELWEREKRWILTISAIGGIIVGLLCAMQIEMPEGYVVPRSQADMESEETYYLESEDDARYAGYQIMGYQDAETKMQVFDGNLVKMEKVRSCILAMCIASVLLGSCCVGVVFVKAWRKQ